jgi:hypothetical protein
MRPAYRTLVFWLLTALCGLDLRGSVARLAGLEPATGCLDESQGSRPDRRTPSSGTYRRGRSPPLAGAAQVTCGTYVARNSARIDLVLKSAVARRHSQSYAVYWVSRVDDSPEFFVLRGHDVAELEMVAVTFQARLPHAHTRESTE